MAMSKETDWDQKRNEEVCKQNSASVSACAKLLLEGRWTFLGSGDEEKWYGTLSFKPCRKWNSTAEEMMRNVAESGHPAFRCPNQFSSDVLKSRGGEISSIHYNADPKTVVVENNCCRKSAQYFRSHGAVVQQQQFGRNSRVSGPMTRTVLCYQSPCEFNGHPMTSTVSGKRRSEPFTF